MMHRWVLGNSIQMRNNFFAFIILFFMLNNCVFATGMQIPPQSETSKVQQPIDFQKLPSIEKISPTYVQPYIQTDKKSQFTPIIKYNPKIQLEKDPPLKIYTSADVINYKKISLSEAIDYALAHNLEIQSMRLNIPMAKNDIKKANRLQNPYLLSFANTGTAAEDNPDTVGLMFPIEIAKRSARKRLAKSYFELSKGNVLLTELNLRLNVRQAYINLVSAKSELKILNDQRLLLQDLVDIAQKKYKAGAAPAMDIIHAKMTLNQLLIQENSARTEVLVARHKFNLLLESIDFDSLEDYLPEQKEFIYLLTPDPLGKMPDFDKVADLAMSKRLDIKNAKYEVDVAKKELVTVVRKRVPDIEIGAGILYVPAQWSTRGDATKGAYLGFNITNIPLLYLHNPEIKNAKLVVEQKEINYQNIKHHALMELHASYDAFLTAQANLNYYSDILLAESNQFLQMARKSYLIGKTEITSFVFIEQSYRNVMMGYTKALSDYYISWVNVLRDVNDEGFKLNE